MGFCPNCKLEYVEGIKVCPDCKTALVDSLEETTSTNVNEYENLDEYEADLEEAVSPFMSTDLSDEEKLEMIQEMMKRMKHEFTETYKSKEEQYNENSSGAGVLIACGLIGVVFLLLNAFNVINVPLRGFSLTLMNIVMGCLFFTFLASGLRSVFKLKSLKIAKEEEATKINEILDFVKNNKSAGKYSYSKDENFEVAYLELSEKVVEDINEQFPDLEPGFALYIVDRYAGDILDED